MTQHDTREPDVDFTDFVAARGAALQRFAYLVTGDLDAADLVQDALSRTWPRWPTLCASGTAEAYVKRAIVNGSVTRWRKERRTVAVDDPDPFVRDRESDPLAARDAAEHAWALVGSLPAPQRAAVVLRFYEDLPFAEIASILRCPESTARSHVHRAVAAMRDQLQHEREGDSA